MATGHTIVRRAGPWALVAILFAAMASHVLRHPEQWADMKVESPLLVVVAMLACGSAMVFQGLVFQNMTKRFGTELGVIESICLSVMTSAVSQFVPLHGGMAARGMYLKKQHGVELSKFASTFVGYNILRLWVAALIACASSGWFLWQAVGENGLTTTRDGSSHLASLRGIVLFTGGMAFAVSVVCIAQARWRGDAIAQRCWGVGSFRMVFAMLAGLHELVRCPRYLVRLLGLVVLQVIAEVIVVLAAWDAVGAWLSLPAALLLASLGILAALTGLVPGGLGLVELVSVAAGMTVGVEASQSIAAGLVARGASMTTMVIGSPIAMYWLTHLKRRSLKVAKHKRYRSHEPPSKAYPKQDSST